MRTDSSVKGRAWDRPPRARLRITPRALLAVKQLSDPQIHPDGRHVAFVVTEADFDDSSWVSHLWLTEWLSADDPEALEDIGGDDEQSKIENRKSKIDEVDSSADGGNEDPTRQLTYSHEGETHPRWSPSGRYLAFLSTRPDETEPLPDEEDEEEPREQIWILPVDGGEARKLTSAPEGVLDYAWTPDTDQIVYLAPEPRARPVESVRKEQRNRHKIDPVVEQDDRLRRQFWRVDVEERKPKLLFTADYGVMEFTLSPDGERLCYATNYTGDQNDYHQVDLFVRALNGGAAHKLVERIGGKYHPRWSPDGRQIAFLSWLEPTLSYSRESLFGVELPAQDADDAAWPVPCRLLTDPSFDYDLDTFGWSQHDDSLYALARARTGSEVVHVRIGSATMRLDLSGMEERHDLGLDPVGDALVWVQESATALPEIFLRDEQGDVHQLTHLNADFAADYHLPRQEVVQWNGCAGLAIEGILTYPLDYVEGMRCPLIVQVHGGPKGRAANTLQSYSMPPVWSAQGYAVLRPNFRGSDGYGNAFAIANRRDLGGGDFDDIMAGVDWCIERGIADPARMGIMGGSYGGYMTNWAIGHTDRFAAAISMFGIFHLQTDYSNSTLSRWNNEYLGAFYWEDPEIYRRLSPGSYIEQIKTPTLILHGDEDDNTFISNSKELYQALRHRGVTTQFVHYPREGHGLREPNHKLDEMRRCLEWMDRYVRHAGQHPAVYRPGDRVPDSEGLLELCVTKAEMVSVAGQPKPAQNEAETALLEIAFTLHTPGIARSAEPFTLSLNEVRLENVGIQVFRYSGVQEKQTPILNVPHQNANPRSRSPLPSEPASDEGRGDRGEGERRAMLQAASNETQAKAESSTSTPEYLNTRTPEHLLPCGIPLDVHGVKALVEGNNLRMIQYPDPETSQIAFACAVLFRIPKAGGEALLRVADFPPVQIAWTSEEESEQEETEHESAGDYAEK